MEEEAIYILTKLKLQNYLKAKDKYIKLTYNELLDYTVKALKLMIEVENEKNNNKN